MEGYPDPPELRGIIPNSFRHIFETIAMAGAENGGASEGKGGEGSAVVVYLILCLVSISIELKLFFVCSKYLLILSYGPQTSDFGPETQFLVRASYLEIYNEEIRDLLSKDPKVAQPFRPAQAVL